MKQILFALVLLPGTVALANFTGDWAGKGRAHEGSAWQADCDPMDFIIVQTATELRLVSHRFHCRSLNFVQGGELRIDIRDGKTFLDDQELGPITETTAHIAFTDENGGLSWMDFLLKPEGGLHFLEHISSGAGRALEIEGDFVARPAP